MACATLLDPWCKLTETVAGVGGEAARGAVHSGLEAVSRAISQAIAGLVRTTVTWWVGVPSVDVGDQPVVDHLRAWFLPIAVAVTVGGLIAAGARMAVARKANPLIDVTGGLLVIAVVGAIGALVTNMLLKAGDAWSAWVLGQSIGERFGQRMADLLSLEGAAPGFVVVVGVIVLVLSAVQAVLMLLRETAIVILVGMLPLAAAGAMAPGMRGWIKRVVAWLLALICYKPAAAAVYATTFTFIGSGHSGTRERLMGVCALILSLVALPVLIKFFTFATGTVGQHSGGGILGTAVGAMVAVGSLRAGGGGSAAAQAQYTSSRMPPGGPGPGTGTPPGAPTPGSPQPRTDAPDSGDGGRGNRTPAPSPGMATTPSSGPGASAAGTASTAPGTTATGAAGTATGATGATAAGAAAGGPAGAAVAATVAAGQKAADGAKNAAGSAMTPDGSDQT